MKTAATILLLSCLIMPAACTSIRVRLPPAQAPVATGEFRVGAARTDITPMPGFAMGGFAAGGKIARGFWTRLWARAVVFEDPEGNALALVSCDLWAIPGGFADRVAELVATDYGVGRLGREHIVIAATHTHHGPGNFSTASLYNVFGSPVMGFDIDLFEFLAHRTAWTIKEAWRGRRQATLRRSEKPLGRIARNRSLGAFMRNDQPARALIKHNRDNNLPIDKTVFPVEEDAYYAIDPTLTVLRADPDPKGPDEDPIAVLAFYAVHPTSMGPPTEVFSSDLFGVAASILERELDATVVALFNGAEGDVSSNWERQDRPATLKLGRILASGIRELMIQDGDIVNGPVRANSEICRLDHLADPMAGASMLVGSEGDWIFLRDAGWREGMVETDPAKWKDGHEHKKDPLTSDVIHTDIPVDLTPALKHVTKLPKQAWVGIYAIGSVTFATLPGEFSTLLGRKLAASVANALDTDKRILLVGLANEYLSYFVTNSEHEAQHYEGGSMLYGPRSAEEIEARLVHLAAGLQNPPKRAADIKHSYSAGMIKESFGVKKFGLVVHMDRLAANYDSLANVLMDEETGIPVPNHPFFVWIEKRPRWPDDPPYLDAVTPSVHVEEKKNGNWVPLQVDRLAESDLGANFVTTVIAYHRCKCRWVTTWMVPESVDPAKVLKIVVKGTSGRVFESDEFTVAEANKKWGFVGLDR
jgi:neutral ceramidase